MLFVAAAQTNAVIAGTVRDATGGVLPGVTNTVLQMNNTYGTTGASGQVPQAILNGRLVKFDIQVSF
jgi:hypothetical protein